MAKICVYGVGAIGGFLAARLALAGESVTGISRGPQLDAIRQNGLSLMEKGRRRQARVRCVERPLEAGQQDIVIVAMKSHSLPAVADSIAPLLGRDTMVVTAGNGFPWWYFYRSKLGNHPEFLWHVDPGGRLWNAIGPERAIGSVTYPAARVLAPGVIEHVFGDRFTLGEPDGSISPRIGELAGILQGAGLEAATVADIRSEMWAKLVANCAYNPVSLLTSAALDAMLGDAGVGPLLESLMIEAEAVAAAMDIELPLSPGELLDRTRALGAHKTSMLQDMEAGRPVELEPIVGAIRELAQLFGVATPAIDIVWSLAVQRARTAGCYQAMN